MASFKDVAYQILSEAKRPLHSKDITRIAIERDWLKTAGKTPEATMNAQIIVDINKLGERSRFIKVGPSTFAINTHLHIELYDQAQATDSVEVERRRKVASKVSSKQKGDIAEARVAELIILYGEPSLACYRPISDDEGIDLIVKPKRQFKTLYLQIKSRFGDNPDAIFTATVKASSITRDHSMAVVFCFFDTDVGDIWDYVWFVPAPDFIDTSNKLEGGNTLGFVAGRTRRESNKWDKYLIDRRDSAHYILEQLEKIDAPPAKHGAAT
jgi:hypothetical protein